MLEIFVKMGAPEEILYINKPHIGTDILKTVVKTSGWKLKEWVELTAFSASLQTLR